jgi:hypothetical protein
MSVEYLPLAFLAFCLRNKKFVLTARVFEFRSSGNFDASLSLSLFTFESFIK